MEDFEHDADEALSLKIDEFVRQQWGDIYGERVDMVASPYTMSHDAMFVLDTLPAHPNVAVFSAGNGRAFKFGPMLGSALASLVRGPRPLTLSPSPPAEDPKPPPDSHRWCRGA
jgi:sarcosine oxidase